MVNKNCKSAVLATVADSRFVQQAKQLFASAHYSGGWTGDYLLLSFGLSPTQIGWFENRGVIVKRCDPIFSEWEWDNRVPRKALDGTSRYSVATMGKFYLLKPDIRRWRNVVYLDCDIIVRATLRRLASVEAFSAVPDYGKTLANQFVQQDYAEQLDELLDSISQRHSLNARTFNAGVFAFPTNVISDAAFDKIVAISRQYLKVARYGDQLAWNLYFYRRWRPLSYAYNYFVYYLHEFSSLNPEQFYGAILHFPGLDQRPWDPTNVFNKEWLENLERAENWSAHTRFESSLADQIPNRIRLQWAQIRDRIYKKKL